MKVEFKTTLGANVVLTAHASGVDAEVNGKMHTHDGALFGNDAEIGPHVILAGRVKAVIAPEYISGVSEFFAAAPAYIAADLEKVSAEYWAEYKGSRQEFSDQMARRMYSKNSDH